MLASARAPPAETNKSAMAMKSFFMGTSSGVQYHSIQKMLSMFSDANQKMAGELLEAIRFFNQKGWSPATSTNYSVRSQNPQEYIISRSGVDKSQFTLEDFILIDSQGEVLAPFNKPGIKSSAETEIHTFI